MILLRRMKWANIMGSIMIDRLRPLAALATDGVAVLKH
jgi:hypothetical protein